MSKGSPIAIYGIPRSGFTLTIGLILNLIDFNSQQLKTFLSLLPAFILLAWLFKRYPKHRFYTLFTAGVLFSLIRLGKVNGHYLLQVYPFMILLIGILMILSYPASNNHLSQIMQCQTSEV